MKMKLAHEFEIKDLGQLRYFLGIEAAKFRQWLSISHCKYTLDLLTETGMTACKPSETLIDPNHRFTVDMGDRLIDARRNQCLVGRPSYLSHSYQI